MPKIVEYFNDTGITFNEDLTSSNFNEILLRHGADLKAMAHELYERFGNETEQNIDTLINHLPIALQEISYENDMANQCHQIFTQNEGDLMGTAFELYEYYSDLKEDKTVNRHYS